MIEAFEHHFYKIYHDTTSNATFFLGEDNRMCKFYRKKRMGNAIMTQVGLLKYSEMGYLSEYYVRHKSVSKYFSQDVFGDTTKFMKCKLDDKLRIVYYEDSQGHWYDAKIISTPCPFDVYIEPVSNIWKEFKIIIRQGGDEYWELENIADSKTSFSTKRVGKLKNTPFFW